MTMRVDAAVNRIREDEALDPARARFALSLHAKFEAWCRGNGLEVSPADEETIVLYLFSRREELAHSTLDSYSRLLAHIQTSYGHPWPLGAMTANFLAAAAKKYGNAKRAKTDAWSVHEMETALTHYSRRGIDGTHLTARGVLVAAWHLRRSPHPHDEISDPVWLAYNLDRNAIIAMRDQIVLRPEGRPAAVIARGEDPVGFHALIEALLLQPEADRPLIWPGVSRSTYSSKMRRILDRDSAKQWSASGEWQQYVVGLSIAERDWHLRRAQPRYGEMQTDLAEFLLGAVTSRRAAELNRLTLGDISVNSDGLPQVFVDSREKSCRISVRQGGQPRSKLYVLNHEHPLGGDPCGITCAACALLLQVESRQRQGAASTERLFTTKRGKPRNTAVSREAVIRIWLAGVESGDAPSLENKVVGSRTLRVTAATLASESGMDLDEIADLMMCSMTNVSRYNRAQRFSEVDCLPVDGGLAG